MRPAFTTKTLHTDYTLKMHLSDLRRDSNLMTASTGDLMPTGLSAPATPGRCLYQERVVTATAAREHHQLTPSAPHKSALCSWLWLEHFRHHRTSLPLLHLLTPGWVFLCGWVASLLSSCGALSPSQESSAQQQSPAERDPEFPMGRQSQEVDVK